MCFSLCSTSREKRVKAGTSYTLPFKRTSKTDSDSVKKITSLTKTKNGQVGKRRRTDDCNTQPASSFCISLDTVHSLYLPSCPSRVTALQKNSCLDEGWISDTQDGKRELDNIHMLSEVNQLDNPSKNLLKFSKCGPQRNISMHITRELVRNANSSSAFQQVFHVTDTTYH